DPEHLGMLTATGCQVSREITCEMRSATIVVDALLGTGIKGPATGAIAESIRAINHDFPLAKVVAVDIPSGMPSDTGAPVGECARADYTITFTALKVAQLLPPNCDRIGELRVSAIGSPSELFEQNPAIFLSRVEPRQFRHLLAPRAKAGHKGDYGHALVIGGAAGKAGAAAMAGIAALRAGAGLVTVACSESSLAAIAPELMTVRLPGVAELAAVVANRDVVALGPGLGTAPEIVALARTAMNDLPQPMVIDADGLNALAGAEWSGTGKVRVLTPHPGEMSRLTGKPTSDVQADRVTAARTFAISRGVTLVLKGQRSLIAFADGRVWVNPTGTPAMATGGSGDILTGLIAGLLAQFPGDPDQAVAAAVYLHGLCGELGARELGEKSLIATDLLRYLPAAIHACATL
ncbi:MAG: NAD(P)H-hydrate dehydratase, partial [Bryobacteraceae bacterium]